MKHWISIGYLGKHIEVGTTIKAKGEPITTIDKIIKFLNIEKEKLKVDIDSNLIWQGSDKEKSNEIKKIWKNIATREIIWSELRKQLFQLLELGDGLLPIAFDIKYNKLEISVVDCEFYFIICSDDKNKLEEISKIFDDLEERVQPIYMYPKLKIEIK